MIYSGDATCPAFTVANGIVNYNKPAVEDGQYPSSTRATLTCNEGYVEGNPGASRICTTSGVWGGNYLMRCLRKKINKL